MPAINPPDRDSPEPLRQDWEVFILGAGFSKAICSQMPTLDELGRRIVEPFEATPSSGLLPLAATAALDAGRLPGGSFEAWLSNLATPAPFLDQAERLHNAAIAQELVKLGVDEIERSESETLSAAMPPWLGRLVSLWDRLGATIITFNYDTLVEQAVNASRMPWLLWPNYEGVLNDAVAVDLLKMHGSTNWWWIPSDRVGTTVRPAPLAGQWGKPVPPSRIAGMEPFVVPPVAVKSEYYDLSITRQSWQSAREALSSAKRLVLMGYSAPVTDLTVSALLGNYADPDLPCDVVDVSATGVTRRMKAFGLRNVIPHGGREPIRNFAANYEYEVSKTAAVSLLRLFDAMDISPDDPVVARIGGSTFEPRLLVRDIRKSHDTTAFVVREWQPGEVAADIALKVRTVRDAIEDASHASRRLVLEIPGQPVRAVLNIARRIFTRNWLAVET